jgi:hypothetical protein
MRPIQIMRLRNPSGGGGSPPVDTDPFFPNVSALLHFNGADGSTTFTDQTAKPWTPQNSAAIDTAQSKFGGASFEINSTQYIDTVAHASLQLGTSEFTLEGWIRPAGFTTGSYKPILADLLYPSAGGWSLYRISTALEFWKGGAKVAENTGSISESVWTHFAVVRRNDAGTLKTRVYVAGVGGTEVTDSTNYTNDRLQIGRVFSGSNLYFAGHIDEVRVTRGVARYTGNFTPPTAAFPDAGPTDTYYSNVSSLLHFNEADTSTAFVDEKGVTWTATADAKTRHDVSKFGVGALKLDGTGDYLTSSSPAGFDFGTGQFTFEGWVYLDDTATNWLLSGINDGTGTGWAMSARHTGFSNVIRFFHYTSPTTGTGHNGGTAVTTGTWHHIAFTRDASDNLRGFLDGNLEFLQASFTSNYAAPSRVRIGATPQTSGIQVSAACRVDDLRVTKGVCRYTANFTPPTAPFPDS